MNNGRFATCLHILTLLASQPGEWLSSDYIAGSININPVLVRKEIISLRGQGMIVSKEGKGGGSMLAIAPQKIVLSEVFKATQQSRLLGRTNDPNNNCPIGRKINQHIDQLFDTAEQAVLNKLSKTTLAEFCAQF